jgi:hypothetical protein
MSFCLQIWLLCCKGIKEQREKKKTRVSAYLKTTDSRFLFFLFKDHSCLSASEERLVAVLVRLYMCPHPTI